MSIKFENYAEPIQHRGDRQYYRWRLFMDEPPEIRQQIKSVEYVLHPTFPDPIQVRTDPEDQFALETSGWGSFMAAIRVYYKDGRVEDSSYWVDLKKTRPMSTTSE